MKYKLNQDQYQYHSSVNHYFLFLFIINTYFYYFPFFLFFFFFSGKMSKMKFSGWNIRGIGSQAKMTKVLTHLIKLQADVISLQETHLSPSEQQKLKYSQYNQVFSATFNSRQRGVSILIHKTLPLVINSTITDPEGRYIIIHASLYSENYIIANVCGPNNDDFPFFHTFFSSFNNLPDSCLIIRGDFNTVIDHTIDKSHTQNTFNHGLHLK